MTEPIHVYVAGEGDDPRDADVDPEGVVVHRGPRLHPDDMTIINGLPVTSLARTLLDCAEVCGPEELREMFTNAQRRGLLDVQAVRRSRARVEWRPSLAMFDAVFAEFDSEAPAQTPQEG
jgi:predicted transcriptional regulator of viral defense system